VTVIRVVIFDQCGIHNSLIITCKHVHFPEAAADSRKLRLEKWKEEKQQQKLLKKAIEKPVFKCGVVHHKMGSPYLNDLSNMSHIERNKTSSSTLAWLEHPTFRQKAAAMKKTSVTDNTKSFAPSNFKFKVVE
jgi:hypothetical protein